MVTLEQEKMRREGILRRMNPTPLRDRYQGVLRIEGEVQKYYGITKGKEEHFNIAGNQSCNPAVIYCDNTQCTRAYVDLNEIIASMVSERKTQQEGIELCTGRDGFAYSYQCRTRVEYKITITYE